MCVFPVQEKCLGGNVGLFLRRRKLCQDPGLAGGAEGIRTSDPYLCDGGVCGNLGLFSERANSSTAELLWALTVKPPDADVLRPCASREEQSMTRPASESRAISVDFQFGPKDFASDGGRGPPTSVSMAWAWARTRRSSVGRRTSSVTQARRGSVAQKRAASATCSGWGISGRSSAVGGTGRVLRIGVSTSLGERQMLRMPWMPSSALRLRLRATTAALAPR